jgi:hypothetical protein
MDITHDRIHGVDCTLIAADIIKSEDPRVKYMIWNSRIVSGNGGPKPWKWRSYGGANPHNKHIHISVEDSGGDPEGLFDKVDQWKLVMFADIPPETAAAPPVIPRHPTLQRGSEGESVKILQGMLIGEGYRIKVDGNFGPITEKYVRLFQKSNGLISDGSVGPYTWEMLES